MEYDRILTDMCIDFIELLHKLYLDGVITKEVYFEHIQLKLLYLRDNKIA
jgi:hypothetical protein